MKISGRFMKCILNPHHQYPGWAPAAVACGMFGRGSSPSRFAQGAALAPVAPELFPGGGHCPGRNAAGEKDLMGLVKIPFRKSG